MTTLRIAMKRIPSLAGALLLLPGQPSHALEAPRACFRSMSEAVAQTHGVEAAAMGTSLLSGYRLERLQRDAFSHRTWATVSSCEHPEWPPAIVAANGVAALESVASANVQAAEQKPARAQAVQPAVPMVRAGSVVRVVQQSQFVRMEMQGVAQANGYAGDRLRVRVIESVADAGRPERFLAATVRSADLLEMEP